MNVAAILLVSLALLVAGYFTYGRLIARLLGVDPSRPTPAVLKNDGVDYVPTKPVVLFGHHFASIAAAGPIVGPTLALIYGFSPGWLWIVLGVIFIGAVHDFTALFVSLRSNGKSVAEVARLTLGKAGFGCYLAFAVVLCILVAAAFLDIAATALTSTYPLDRLELAEGQRILRTVVVEGVLRGHIGGIASTSVILMTASAPLMGWLIYKRGIPMGVASALALLLAIATVIAGVIVPVTMAPRLWMGIICVYTVFAAWLPVWLILQPRDFVNVHLLYLGIFAMVAGLVAAGLLAGTSMAAPTLHLGPEASDPATGALAGFHYRWPWPLLFVTIACGAASGAHGLICGGTSCKQLSSEAHAHPIGYGGMLLEGLLGLSVLLLVGSGLGWNEYLALVWPVEGRANAPLAFALSIGRTLDRGFHIPTVYGTIFGILLLEGFVLTTLDTLMRLTRYLLEELWETLLGERRPAILKNPIFNSLLPVSAMAALGFTNAYQAIWPIFGTANQLLAALTLTAATLWLHGQGRRVWYTAVPAAFMGVTTIASLGILVFRDAGQRKWVLLATDVVLIGLTAAVLGLVARRLLGGGTARPQAEVAA